MPFARPTRLLAFFFAVAFAPMSFAGEFSFESLDAEAAALAAAPYSPVTESVDPFFQNLDYDFVSKIRFRDEAELWRDTDKPFSLRFFNPAKYHESVVRIATLADGKKRDLQFDPAAFDWGAVQKPDAVPWPSGYAGFKMLGRLNPAHAWTDEFTVFLGATYFRCVPAPRDAVYGLSARAVAIDTAASGCTEEFPVFRVFRIVEPKAGEKQAVVYALMDSPTLAGAFRFEITPGARVVTKVKAALHFRKKPTRLGLAPFSSMYAFGDNSPDRPADYRSAVHDSDGLSIILKNGQRLWRPLENDRVISLNPAHESVFDVGTAKSFGLRQRNVDFAAYSDLENHYHKRPGVMVTPGAGWPEGAIHLFELSSGEEDWDNIVQYWQPKKIPGAGESLKYEYTITWALEPDFDAEYGRVIATRRGPPTRLGAPSPNPALVRFHIDFAQLAPNVLEAPELLVIPDYRCQIHATKLEANPATKGWRAIIDVLPEKGDYEVGVVLRHLGLEVSERWTSRPVPLRK